jgi:flavin-binding protein dodecin
MITDVEIKKLLTALNALYSSCKDVDLEKMYSKAAVIEFCGWLEDSFDEIIRNCVNKASQPVKDILNKTIKNTHGFNYKIKSRSLLVAIMGEECVEKLESSITTLVILESLTKFGDSDRLLVNQRNAAAHKTITYGVTPYFDTPSVMIGYLNDIFPILKEIETKSLRIVAQFNQITI